MKSSYKCPICDKILEHIPGTKINPTDGITIYCPNPECPMNDWGHGKNEDSAFEVYKQKCGK